MKKFIGMALTVGVLAVALFVLFKIASHNREETHSTEERGRYLAIVGGCNDCHTPGYAEKAGKVDESQWLVGDTLGWQGPWGTTYAINLRLYMEDLTEEQWLQIVSRMRSRPPMPYFNLQRMSEEDLRALYRYIRSLKVAGSPAPPFLPPGVQATTPVFRFIPPPG